MNNLREDIRIANAIITRQRTADALARLHAHTRAHPSNQNFDLTVELQPHQIPHNQITTRRPRHPDNERDTPHGRGLRKSRRRTRRRKNRKNRKY
jgi:hypothetical protein